MTLWDTHCHWADARFAADRPETLGRAAAVGVGSAVVVGTDPAGWKAVAALAETTQPVRLYGAYGLHPHEASAAGTALWADLERHLRRPGTVALGEIGLDYHYDHSPRPEQRRAFEHQLHLAAAAGLPVILHERDAAKDVLAVLRATGLPPRGGVWHCFSGDPDLAAEAVALGLHLGFGGLVTFRRGTEAVRAAARSCPAERLLLETDSPYLAPVPHRGQRNEPGWVTAVAEFLAAWREVPLPALAETTSANAAGLFLPAAGEPARP